MHNYEVEIKSLLGSKQNADELLEKLKADPSFVAHGEHKELNHYFVDGDLSLLLKNVKEHLSENEKQELQVLIKNAKSYSLRTRWANQNVMIVVKASVDDTTSFNGTARIEFEPVIKDLTLKQLDKIVLDSGFKYQAKWSRDRQEFKYRGMNVSIDRNAGYGYLTEFEKIVDDPNLVDLAKVEIRAAMGQIGLTELPQDRLARMFDYYNQNWQDYYGTDKIFNIE